MTGRFLAFGGQKCYPKGGWRDFAGRFDTVEEAEAAAKLRACPKENGTYESNQFWHVVDLEKMSAVRRRLPPRGE